MVFDYVLLFRAYTVWFSIAILLQSKSLLESIRLSHRLALSKHPSSLLVIQDNYERKDNRIER